jgi:two-component sensor histidine kinase
VALAELLTNAVEHAFEGDELTGEQVGVVSLTLRTVGRFAIAEIRDNGRGLDDSFSLEVPTSLGLSIVRDLIRAQLRGTIEMTTVDASEGGGTLVRVKVPTAFDD